MKSRYARKIHPRMPWQIPGSNVPAPVPWQQPAQAPQTPAPVVSAQQPPGARRVPQRPSEARTLAEAAEGMMVAAGRLRFVNPRFPDTKGSWIKLGEHQCRVPLNSIVAIQRADNGRDFAVVSGTNGTNGFWVLTDRPDGIREVVGLLDGFRAGLRRAAFGQ